MAVRAVLFDLGGVVLGSPIHAIADYERERGLPPGAVNRLVVERGDEGAWSRLERGELSMEDFFGRFDRECAEAGLAVSTRELMERIGAVAEPRPLMVEAVRRLRERALAVAALTNNWAGPEDPSGGVREIFDHVLESSRLGLRKPDPRIYEHACSVLAVRPPEVAFLDDIGRNLKPARELGMTTIKVDEPESALDALAEVVGFPLR